MTEMLAGNERLDAGEAADEIRLPVAIEPRHADDLAGVEREIDRRRPRPDAGLADTHDGLGALPLGDGVARFSARALFAGDQLEDTALGDLLAFQAADIDAVAEHCRAIGNADELGGAMGDDEDAGALAPSAAASS